MGQSTNILGLRAGITFKWKYFFVSSHYHDYFFDVNLVYNILYKYLYFLFNVKYQSILMNYGFMFGFVRIRNDALQNNNIRIYIYDEYYLVRVYSKVSHVLKQVVKLEKTFGSKEAKKRHYQRLKELKTQLYHQFFAQKWYNKRSRLFIKIVEKLKFLYDRFGRLDHPSIINFFRKRNLILENDLNFFKNNKKFQKAIKGDKFRIIKFRDFDFTAFWIKELNIDIKNFRSYFRALAGKAHPRHLDLVFNLKTEKNQMFKLARDMSIDKLYDKEIKVGRKLLTPFLDTYDISTSDVDARFRNRLARFRLALYDRKSQHKTNKQLLVYNKIKKFVNQVARAGIMNQINDLLVKNSKTFNKLYPHELKMFREFINTYPKFKKRLWLIKTYLIKNYKKLVGSSLSKENIRRMKIYKDIGIKRFFKLQSRILAQYAESKQTVRPSVLVNRFSKYAPKNTKVKKFKNKKQLLRRDQLLKIEKMKIEKKNSLPTKIYASQVARRVIGSRTKFDPLLYFRKLSIELLLKKKEVLIDQSRKKRLLNSLISIYEIWSKLRKGEKGTSLSKLINDVKVIKFSAMPTTLGLTKLNLSVPKKQALKFPRIMTECPNLFMSLNRFRNMLIRKLRDPNVPFRKKRFKQKLVNPYKYLAGYLKSRFYVLMFGYEKHNNEVNIKFNFKFFVFLAFLFYKLVFLKKVKDVMKRFTTDIELQKIYDELNEKDILGDEYKVLMNKKNVTSDFRLNVTLVAFIKYLEVLTNLKTKKLKNGQSLVVFTVILLKLLFSIEFDKNYERLYDAVDFHFFSINPINKNEEEEKEQEKEKEEEENMENGEREPKEEIVQEKIDDYFETVKFQSSNLNIKFLNYLYSLFLTWALYKYYRFSVKMKVKSFYDEFGLLIQNKLIWFLNKSSYKNDLKVPVIEMYPTSPKVISMNHLLLFWKWKLKRKFTINQIVWPFIRSFNYTVNHPFAGFAVKASGRFTRRQRASFKKYVNGRLAYSTLRYRLSYSFIRMITKYGSCGVKVWVRLNGKIFAHRKLSSFYKVSILN